jgi:5'(3')-deoxyribonucleotidase
MNEFGDWAQDHDGHTLFRHLEVYPGALEVLEKLAERHDIVIVTTKPRWAVHDTFAWIADHRIPTREVHITRQKWRVDCDIFLDDAPHVLTALAERSPATRICRFVRPWNEPLPGVVDVESWDGFAELVRSVPDQIRW